MNRYTMVAITIVLLLLMALPIKAQAPTSSLSNIYNQTLPMPDNVCYRADGTAMLTADYNYNLSITYTTITGDIIAIRYGIGTSGDYYIAGKIVITAGNVKPYCGKL